MASRKKKKTLIPKEIGEILIDIFHEKSGQPIILFEEGLSEPRFIDTSTKHFSDFCKYVHSCGASYKCTQDHLERASECYEPQISMCWFGLANATVPIFVNDARKAIILYGQKRLNEPEELLKSEKQFYKSLNELCKKLPVNETQRNKIIQKFKEIPKIDRDKLDPKLLEDFRKLNRWFYSVISDKVGFENDVKQVNHELANNLQAAIGDAEILSIYIEGSEECYNRFGEGARNIFNSLKRMNDVVQNFGNFLGNYNFRPFDLEEAINDSIETYKVLAEEKNVLIEKYTLDSKPFRKIFASERHMKLALNNIIHNAIKYSHRGFHREPSKPMTVNIFGERHGNGYRFSVQNFGVGILENEITSGKIFEPGYKGKLTKKEFKTGGGYGLSKVKEIIDVHKASFTIESNHKAENIYVTTATITFDRVVEE